MSVNSLLQAADAIHDGTVTLNGLPQQNKISAIASSEQTFENLMELACLAEAEANSHDSGENHSSEESSGRINVKRRALFDLEHDEPELSPQAKVPRLRNPMILEISPESGFSKFDPTQVQSQQVPHPSLNSEKPLCARHAQIAYEIYHSEMQRTLDKINSTGKVDPNFTLNPDPTFHARELKGQLHASEMLMEETKNTEGLSVPKATAAPVLPEAQSTPVHGQSSISHQNGAQSVAVSGPNYSIHPDPRFQGEEKTGAYLQSRPLMPSYAPTAPMPMPTGYVTAPPSMYGRYPAQYHPQRMASGAPNFIDASHPMYRKQGPYAAPPPPQARMMYVNPQSQPHIAAHQDPYYYQNNPYGVSGTQRPNHGGNPGVIYAGNMQHVPQGAPAGMYTMTRPPYQTYSTSANPSSMGVAYAMHPQQQPTVSRYPMHPQSQLPPQPQHQMRR